MKKLILLNQLGSPKSPNVKDVRKYLKEFLSDPRVIDIPKIIRFFLLRLIILPFRSKKSSKAYQKIWDSVNGSPLIFNSEKLINKMKKKIDKDTTLILYTRYGDSSLKNLLKNIDLNKFENITLLPLYPQYSSSTTGSTIENFYKELSTYWNQPNLSVISYFYNHPLFIKSWVEKIMPYLKKNYHHIIFSFHGLPTRHIKKSEGKQNYCLKKKWNCCATINENNRYCYRAQCVATTKNIIQKLKLKDISTSISFQSRLGSRDPWIEPYLTEEITKKFYKNKKVLVVPLSFVSDCLETLEELKIQLKKDFIQQGGKELTVIDSLNDHPTWIKCCLDLVNQE